MPCRTAALVAASMLAQTKALRRGFALDSAPYRKCLTGIRHIVHPHRCGAPLSRGQRRGHRAADAGIHWPLAVEAADKSFSGGAHQHRMTERAQAWRGIE